MSTSPEELSSDPLGSRIDNIDMAADILRRMLVELQSLEVHCARLHFAMSSSEHAIRQELDMLCGIAELLRSGEAPLRTHELNQRANRLISRLATQLEQLSLQTEHDLRVDHLASLPHSYAM